MNYENIEWLHIPTLRKCTIMKQHTSSQTNEIPLTTVRYLDYNTITVVNSTDLHPLTPTEYVG